MTEHQSEGTGVEMTGIEVKEGETATLTQDRRFAQKRKGLAWHAVTFHTRGLTTWETVCGRVANDPVVEVLPWGDGCGSCLAINTRRDEQLIERAKPNEDPEPGDAGE